MRRALFAGLVVTLFVLATALTVLGQQTTGSLNGTVVDPSGATVAGATISVVNNATGAERGAVSSTAGTFDLQALQPGTYTITVDAKGFKRAVSRDIVVSVATTAQVNIPLEVGSANETVTVTAAQEVINTTTPSITNVVNTRQVVDLPLINRDPTQLAGLQAGIAVVGTDVRSSSISGLRPSAVNKKHDGI